MGVATELQAKKLAEGLLEGKSTTEAILDAGYSKNTAEKQQARTVGSRRVQSYLNEAWDKAGITDELLAHTHLAGLRATKLHNPPDAPSMEVPDHPTRKGFLDMAYKLKNFYPDQKTLAAELNAQSGTLRVVMGFPEGEEDE